MAIVRNSFMLYFEVREIAQGDSLRFFASLLCVGGVHGIIPKAIFEMEKEDGATTTEPPEEAGTSGFHPGTSLLVGTVAAALMVALI